MASLKVVEAQVVIEGAGAPVRAAEGSRVGPFGEQRADHPLGLAVGLGAVGAGKALADPELQAGRGEDQRAIGPAVVREQSLDGDAVTGKPGDGAHEEGGGRLAQLVGQDLRVRQARVIVDGDVEALPADAPHPCLALAVNAVPDASDLAQLLDVEMDQLPGPWPLVPHDRPRRLKGGQRVQPLPPQLGRDGRQRTVVVLRDARAAPALLAGFPDLAPFGASQPRGRGLRPRGAVRRRLRRLGSQ